MKLIKTFSILIFLLTLVACSNSVIKISSVDTVTITSASGAYPETVFTDKQSVTILTDLINSSKRITGSVDAEIGDILISFLQDDDTRRQFYLDIATRALIDYADTEIGYSVPQKSIDSLMKLLNIHEELGN